MTDSEKYKLVREALVGIVGTDDTEELKVMEAAVRNADLPKRDKAVTIDAIHALQETKE